MNKSYTHGNFSDEEVVSFENKNNQSRNEAEDLLGIQVKTTV